MLKGLKFWIVYIFVLSLIAIPLFTKSGLFDGFSFLVGVSPALLSPWLAPWIVRKINKLCVYTKKEQNSGNVSSYYVASAVKKNPPFNIATVDPPSVSRKIKDRDRLVASEQKKLFEVVSMAPIEFELYCAQLLNEDGWDAETTKASGDQGVDIVATRKGIKCVFQVKKHNKPVGNKAVQEVHAGRSFYGNVDFAFVVTNKGFTSTAKALAKATEVHLIHYSELCDLSKYIRI
jgi:HJR/Mrr/RecB family endonuclease